MEPLENIKVGQIEEVLHLSGHTLWAISVEGIVIDVLGALEDGLGYDRDELRGRELLDIIEPEHKEEAVKQFLMVLNGTMPVEEDFEIELRAVGKDGRGHDIKVNAATVSMDEDDQPVAIGLSTDITRQKVAERALERERELFFEAFENAPNGMVLLHLDGVRGALIKGVNAVAMEMTGYRAEDVIGVWLLDGTIIKVEQENVAKALDDSRAVLAGERSSFSIERDLFKHDGSTFRLRAEVSALDVTAPGSRDDPSPINAIAHIRDVTEQRETEDELHYQARHDPLTDLLNRRWFVSLLSDRLDRSARGHGGGALLMIDLDDFKQVNDGHGHHAGDGVLREVARILSAELRGTDLVSRIGGDEFAALLPKTDQEGALRVARSLLDRLLGSKVEIEGTGETFLPSVSIGIMMLDGLDIDAETALRECDRTMYEAKRQGGARYLLSSD